MSISWLWNYTTVLQNGIIKENGKLYKVHCIISYNCMQVYELAQMEAQVDMPFFLAQPKEG